MPLDVDTPRGYDEGLYDEGYYDGGTRTAGNIGGSGLGPIMFEPPFIPGLGSISISFDPPLDLGTLIPILEEPDA